ncbi:MAG TPA: ABC transporter permease, partial [Acidimicrobiales bacterium]|nr:ABC transporter permease [Acidimicrobiales bacterium]
FAVPGVADGCAFAVFAVGLVLTYQTTGVFNLGYGAQAYASAFVFTWLVENRGWPTWAGFVCSVVILGPGLGLVFDRFLFRRIPSANTTAKIVTGLSLLVGIPALLPVVFGNGNLVGAPSILFNPDVVYFHLGSDVPVNGIYLSAVLLTVVMLVVLVLLLRTTSLGLEMRAGVESRRLLELEGVNAPRVTATAWAVCGLMAGLAGVLLAPTEVTVQAQDYVTLMVVAIAAAACAAMRSMSLAAVVAVLIGVVSLTAQGYLPTASFWYSAVLPAFPFVVLVCALLFVPGLRRLDEAKDPLSTVDPPPPPPAARVRGREIDRVVRTGFWVLLCAFVASMLTWMPPAWETVLNQGLAYSVIFLSVTLLTGTAGQLSLAQATLAGIAAFTAGQLANHLGLDFLVGAVLGAMAASLVAGLLALVSLRLRGLGLALMTLAAALLFDVAIFPSQSVSGGTGGITLKSSWLPFDLFAPDGHAYFLLALAVLVVCAGGVAMIQRGTVGRFLAAMRGSELGAAGIGVNLPWQRVLAFALSGALAGVGGTLLAIQQTVIAPGGFNYQLSLAFVVIVVTTGVGTVEGAMQAGIGLVVVQQLLQYAPQRLQGLTFVLFALGALTYAAHPEGIVELEKRRWTERAERTLAHRHGAPATWAVPGRP